VFDSAYNLNKNKVKRQATNHIHNYFLTKSLDLLKEGGMLAHIMPYGVLDSPAHLPIRQFILANSNLISAIRLPQNTFLDAGTQAGADLLILQKTRSKTSLSANEQALVRTSFIIHDASNNKYQLNEYFSKNRDAIVSDELKFGKDQYGKPNLEYLKKGGIPAICQVVDEILVSDFKRNYRSNNVENRVNNRAKSPDISQKKPSNVFQLDLFGSSLPVVNSVAVLQNIPEIPKKIPYNIPLKDSDVDGQFIVQDEKIFKLSIDVGVNYLNPTDYWL
jgi:type I restriction-modification system DNA methylase subunit